MEPRLFDLFEVNTLLDHVQELDKKIVFPLSTRTLLICHQSDSDYQRIVAQGTVQARIVS